MQAQYDIIIVGGGLSGLAGALAGAHKGAAVCLLDAQKPAAHLEPRFDGRASLISAGSFEMLRQIGAATYLKDHVQPITGIATCEGEVGGPLSAPLNFENKAASNPNAPYMGYMMENRHLRRALLLAITDMGKEKIKFSAPFRLSGYEEDGAVITALSDCGEKVTGGLLVAADGAGSRLRKAAGISARRYDYDQSAIVTTVAHERPHHGRAVQIFYPGGPFALLPLTGHRTSIVWSDKTRAANAAMALPEPAFRAELIRRFGGQYGEAGPVTAPMSYPLYMQMAANYTKGRLALIGDAARKVHPLAGQGLNLGLRDGAALADIWAGAQQNGMDPALMLGAYENWRRFDSQIMAGSMDIISRLFTARSAPVRHLRRLGARIIEHIDPAKDFFIREAAGQTGDLPSLMRPDISQSRQVRPATF